MAPTMTIQVRLPIAAFGIALTRVCSCEHESPFCNTCATTQRLQQDVKVFIQSTTQLPANKQVQRSVTVAVLAPNFFTSDIKNFDYFQLTLPAEAHPGRARRAQGRALTGILQRFVRHRIFTAAKDPRRQVGDDEACRTLLPCVLLTRHHLSRGKGCASLHLQLRLPTTLCFVSAHGFEWMLNKRQRWSL
jgi:hypothetical protein